ncbi:MAG: uracil-DNA glycosylase [Gammaproteobacteria bacterium]|nr:MAG: uracil-DNA glycosylase [Gammaproteobacteria bacterium TMED236]
MNILDFPDTWLEPLGKGFCKDFLYEIESKFLKLNTEDLNIFPPIPSIFRALKLVNFNDAKVLILGQDPYHGFGQADGLSFSVNKEIKIPPSLKNIFLELRNDLNIPISRHGDLTVWAQQKILLLNSVLTVEQGKPNSHQGLGWEKLTDKIITQLSQRGNMIFVLWGNIAQKKYNLIDKKHNKILTAPHPSPLSSYRGFLGCKHFSKINRYLIDNGSSEIDWKLD